MRILIVDDSKAMRMIVTRTLRQAGFAGHDITEATNGQEGFDAVAAQLPDLVLCDWNMPEMTGIQFLGKLRATGVEVPFVFITSETSPEMRELAAAAGALSLIAKPFSADDFEAVLGPVLT
jgi:two-component system, chemotaxis family, chemotaxis protein CheY